AALARERTFLYQNRINFAASALEDNTPHRTEELLDECPLDHRNWEWNYLKRQCHTELTTFQANDGPTARLVVSPDGRLIATTSWKDDTVRLWDSDTGRRVRTLTGHGKDFTGGIAFSPDGARIASVDGSLIQHGRALVHDVATANILLSVPVDTGQGAHVW